MNNSHDINDIYTIIAVIILFQFAWYYFTLPGFKISNNKYPKPTIKIALKSYLIYILPIFIGLYLLNDKDKKCMAINLYYNAICGK